MKRINQVAAIALLMASAGASAAPVDYRFDSVSAFNAGRDAGPGSLSPARGLLSVTGVLQNSTTPTTVSFLDSAYTDGSFLNNRCVPILLTMMEKPGRYVLKLSVDASDTAAPLISCGLELKS
jgi:hypothetical protein